MPDETCPTCEGALVAAEMLLMLPEERIYPGVRCKVVYDCPNCAGVFEAWATAGAPMIPMPDDLRELRAMVNSKQHEGRA